MRTEKKFQLTIVSPERTLFDGWVDSVVFPGDMGSFAVLRDHAPLISSLGRGTVKYQHDGNEQTIDIASGFVEVKANCVSAYIETEG